MKNSWRPLLAALAVVVMTAPLRAETILDTGPINAGSFDLTPVNSHFWKAHPFELTGQTRIDVVEGFLMRNQGESERIKAAVFSNGPENLPGTRLFEAEFFVPLTGNEIENAGWHGASELNWSLAPGKYWVSLVVDEGNSFSGLMPFDADETVTSARWLGPEEPPFPGEPPIPASWNPSTAKLGFRISGEPVPEPTHGSITLGLFVFASSLCSRRATASSKKSLRLPNGI